MHQVTFVYTFVSIVIGIAGLFQLKLSEKECRKQREIDFYADLAARRRQD